MKYDFMDYGRCIVYVALTAYTLYNNSTIPALCTRSKMYLYSEQCRRLYLLYNYLSMHYAPKLN